MLRYLSEWNTCAIFVVVLVTNMSNVNSILKFVSIS